MKPAFFTAFQNSLSGLKLAWSEDASYRRAVWQVLVIAALAIGLRFNHSVDDAQCAILIVALMPILIVELINCAIEAVTDKASPDYSHLAKKAKDIASATVLMTRIMALLIWAAVLLSAFDIA